MQIFVISEKFDKIERWKCVYNDDCQTTKFLKIYNIPYDYREVKIDSRKCPLIFVRWNEPHIQKFSYKLAKLLSSPIKYIPVFHIIDKKFEKIYPGLNFHYINNGTYDVTMGPSNKDFTKYMSYSNPYLISYSSVFFKLSEKMILSDVWKNILNYNILLWLSVVFLLIYVILRNSRKYYQKQIKFDVFLFDILEVLFTISAKSRNYNTMINILLITLYFAIVIQQSLYQGYIFKYLTFVIFKKIPNSLLEIFESKFEIITQNKTLIYNISGAFKDVIPMKYQHLVIESNMTQYELNEYWKELPSNVGIIVGGDFFDYFLTNMHENNVQVCRIHRDFRPLQISFYFRKGSILQTLFNKHLGFLIDSGFINLLQKQELSSKPLTNLNFPKSAEPITMKDLWKSFIIFISQLLVSIIIFLLEFLSKIMWFKNIYEKIVI